MFRRGRFADVVQRQLDIFASDEAPLLEEAEETDAAWTNADRDEAEERYGDYQLVVDAIGERLHDVRETYASSLGERLAAEYRATFNAMTLKRFRPFATFLKSDWSE